MRATKAAAHGAKPEALAPRNPTIGSLPVCCADVTGLIAAAPTISVTNSRRLIAAPETSDRGIVAVQVRAVKGCPMSALGQKRTFRKVKTMSALPPKAD